MLDQRPGARLMVFLTEDDRIGRRPAVDVLLERAREEGLAGATVWRGAEGFGRGGRVRSVRFVDTGQGAPLAVELIDTAERIEEFVGTLAHLAPWALVTREPIWMSDRRPARGPLLDDPEPGGVSGG